MRNWDSFLKTYRVTARSFLITLTKIQGDRQMSRRNPDTGNQHFPSEDPDWVMTRELLHFVVQKCHLEINLIIILRVGIRLQSINDTWIFSLYKDRNYPKLLCEMFRILDNNNQLRKIILVCLRQWELKPSIMTHIRGCNYACHSNTIWGKHVFQQHLSFYETVLWHGRLCFRFDCKAAKSKTMLECLDPC